MLVGYIHGKYVKPCFILIVHLEQLGLLVIYSTLTHMRNLHANHTLWEFKIPTSNYIAAKCINHVDYLQVHDCHHETCRLPLWYWRGLPSGWLDPIFLVFLNPKSCRTYIHNYELKIPEPPISKVNFSRKLISKMVFPLIHVGNYFQGTLVYRVELAVPWNHISTWSGYCFI